MSRTITFSAINGWTTLSLVGTFDRVEWSGSGVDFHPYGVDNISFAVVPEPSTFSLWIGAGIVLLGHRRLGYRNAAAYRSVRMGKH